MTKNEAMKKLTEFLKFHNIRHISAIDSGCMQLVIEYSAEIAPNKCVESCVWFYDDAMEARVYYSALRAKICKNSMNIDGLFRVMNYINARVFLKCSDGLGCSLYKPNMLYTPRIYLTEDGCFDSTITTIINYDFFEETPVETADYLTAYCPQLLDKLPPAIFCVLSGQAKEDECIEYIMKNILEQ